MGGREVLDALGGIVREYLYFVCRNQKFWARAPHPTPSIPFGVSRVSDAAVRSLDLSYDRRSERTERNDKPYVYILCSHGTADLTVGWTGGW